MKYDLEERVAKFGEAIIDFAKSLQPNIINKPLISQLIKSATSIGANYMGANQASSKRDFRNKIQICRKEANETKHWIRMILRTNPEKRRECDKLWKEAHELILIFSKISSKYK
jgi:four helix bundle protein